MEFSAKTIVLHRCKAIKKILTVLLFFYGVYTVFQIVLLISASLQPASDFSVSLFKFPEGFASFCQFKDQGYSTFSQRILTQNAAEHPKFVFLAASCVSILYRLITMLMLWEGRKIFKNVATLETPFAEAVSRSVTLIGVYVIVSGIVKNSACKVIFLLYGIGNGGISVVDSQTVSTILIGAIIICLSHIFKYGTALQQESDETL